MNDVINLLKAHRSIRRFTDKPLSDVEVAEILAAAQAASTSSFVQAYSIIRITDPEKRGMLATLAGKQPYVASAAEFWVFCADWQRNFQRVRRQTEQSADFSWSESTLVASIDAALAAQNALIAAQSLGLGGVYIGGIRNDPEGVIALLELPKLVFPLFGLCLGTPAQDPASKARLPQSVVMHENRYQLAEEQHREIDRYDTVVKQYYTARSHGKLTVTWSEQMVDKAARESRQFIKKVLNKQGLMEK